MSFALGSTPPPEHSLSRFGWAEVTVQGMKLTKSFIVTEPGGVVSRLGATLVWPGTEDRGTVRFPDETERIKPGTMFRTDPALPEGQALLLDPAHQAKVF